MAIKVQSLKPGSYNNYFYIKSQEKLFNILNKKKPILILNSKN